MHELSHELPYDLGLRILRSWEILEKWEMWVETQCSGQSSFQNLNFDNSCQRTQKIRCYIVKALPSFTVLLWFVPNVLATIVWGNKFLTITWSSLLHTRTFGYFSNHDVDIKQVSSVKSFKFHGFMLALFCTLGLGQNVYLENFQLWRLIVFWTN